jgi:alkylated DNA repair dioxygenase AlkB
MNKELESLGLSIIHDAISISDEQTLVQQIDQQKWESIYARRTQHYAYLYNYKSRKATPYLSNPTIPSWLLPKHITDIFNPDMIIINEYTKGQSINPHIDSNAFGPIVACISLESDTMMDLSMESKNWSINIPRRSLLIFRNDARSKMTHGLKFNGVRRISITYRTVK